MKDKMEVTVHAPTWRVGRKNNSNIYEGKNKVAKCVDAITAKRIVAAMNGTKEKTKETIRRTWVTGKRKSKGAEK